MERNVIIVEGCLSMESNIVKEMLEKYKPLKVKGGLKLHEMNGDLLSIDKTGRIERIIDATVVKIGKSYWLEIKETSLVDEGIKQRDDDVL